MSRFTRRDFVKTVGVGAAALASAGTTRAEGHESGSEARSTGGHDYDVIVIGGGFAGATAARETSSRGLRTVVLEARNRLGGRTFSSKFAGHKVELGGTWIHWHQPHVWAEVMRYGLDILETPGADPDVVVYLRDGKATRDESGGIWKDFFGAIDRFGAPAAQVLPEPYEPFKTAEAWAGYDRLNISEAIAKANVSSLQAYFLDSIYASVAHTFVEKGSYFDALRWYALAGYGAKQQLDATARYKLKIGTRGLIDKMIEDGKPDVRVGTVVQSVTQKGESATVTTEDGEQFTARAVIVTVPMNVLKDVEFSPPLSRGKLAASAEEHAGKGTKLYVEVAGDLGDVFLMASSKSPIAALFTYSRSADSTLLVGFGPSRDLIDVNDREAVGKVIRSFLPEARVTASFGYDWILDPFSQGTWCFYRPQQATKYWKDLQQREGRLFFASADSADGWRGFIDGAIERGLRSGNQVVELLS